MIGSIMKKINIICYTLTDEKFKELLRVKLDFEAYSTRGFYIIDYLYIVSPSEGIKAVNLTNYDEEVQYRN